MRDEYFSFYYYHFLVKFGMTLKHPCFPFIKAMQHCVVMSVWSLVQYTDTILFILNLFLVKKVDVSFFGFSRSISRDF